MSIDSSPQQEDLGALSDLWLTQDVEPVEFDTESVVRSVRRARARTLAAGMFECLVCVSAMALGAWLLIEGRYAEGLAAVAFSAAALIWTGWRCGTRLRELHDSFEHRDVSEALARRIQLAWEHDALAMSSVVVGSFALPFACVVRLVQTGASGSSLGVTDAVLAATIGAVILWGMKTRRRTGAHLRSMRHMRSRVDGEVGSVPLDAKNSANG